MNRHSAFPHPPEGPCPGASVLGSFIAASRLAINAEREVREDAAAV